MRDSSKLIEFRKKRRRDIRFLNLVIKFRGIFIESDDPRIHKIYRRAIPSACLRRTRFYNTHS